MPWQPSVYMVPLAVAALVAGGTAAYTISHRSRPVATPFFVLLVAITGWAVADAVRLGFATVGSQYLWRQVGLTFGGAIPPIWLVTTLVYAQREDLLTRPRLAGLAVEPLAFAALVWTNPLHGLIWSSVSMPAGRPAILRVDQALAYHVHIVYAYLLVGGGILVLLSVLVRSSSLYRRQAGLLVVGALVPLSANVAFTLGFSPVPGLDLTTFTFTVTGVVFALALFRYDLLNLTPVAYRNLPDEFGDGVLVFDEDGKLVEFNDHAAALLETDLAVGQELPAALPDEEFAAMDGDVLEVDRAGRPGYYLLRHAPIEDYAGSVVGHLLALRDVTEMRRHEQRLEVTNRVLRHNLRNKMNVIELHAQWLTERLTGEQAERAEDIAATTEDVIDTGEKVRNIQDTLEERGERVTADAVTAVAATLAEFRQSSPATDFRLAVPETAPVRVASAGLLEMAVANLVENAIEHNDGEATVAVTVTPAEATDDGRVHVSVADDGPGLPPGERRVIEAGRETPLEHGSGLGLWLVHWIAAASDGRLSFAESDLGGTVATLAFDPSDRAVDSGAQAPGESGTDTAGSPVS